jgi:methylmalonyl-CoA mutase N-terminal domain/subunit
MSASSEPRDEKKVILESGLEVKPVYTAQDVEASGGYGGVGLPGEWPFTRGIHPQMYRKRPFTMRQYSGFGTASETNERFKYLISHGQTGLNVAFDLPTQMGIDSDDAMAVGEVGRVGMAVDTLADMEEAFEGIDLDQISVSLTINGAAAVLMAMYFAMAEKRGYDLSTLRGTAQNDILKEYIGRGTWVFPVSVCGYHIRESGANPVQEMAYGFCIARAYIDHVLARGLDIDDFAPRLSFNFDIHGKLFEQVAKFRAGRRLWARILKEEYGAKDPRSCMMKMIAGGGGGGLTIEQPENNIMRSAYYALASALSGTQTMALCSYDEAYTIPTEKAALLSLRTMQLLIEEVGLSDTVDPLAGSYFVETLTNQIEEKIEGCMKTMDERGGIVKSVAEGYVQAEVSKQAYEYELALRSGDFRKVGVNCYTMEEEKRDVALHPYRSAEAEKQIARLSEVKSERDVEKVKETLDVVRRTATNERANLMPAIMQAVTEYATVGEITAVLKEIFGTYQEPIRF